MPIIFVGLPRWLSGKEFTCQAGDAGLILSREGPLEKERATHSSILAWEIPWTEEPGGLQSMVLLLLLSRFSRVRLYATP